ncbi:MAG: hypothetical protein K2X32_07805 [Phycisphaerales bacterium]|nr:hypothetical protein [Phycisphaerales bacterium]
MTRSIALALTTALTLAAAANASVTFQFADPAGGSQLTNVANGGGAGLGLMTYDTSANIDFFVDGSGAGLLSPSFLGAHLEIAFTLGAGVVLPGGTIQIPVTGTFTVYQGTGMSRVNILTGTTLPSGSGAFFQVGSTQSILFSDPEGFAYTAGPALTPFLAGNSLIDPQEAVFTVTDLTLSSAASLLGAGGVVNSFTANTSFSGNANIPTPGAMALVGVGGLLAARRRR